MISASGYNRGTYKPPVTKKQKWKPGCKCSICGQEVKQEHLSKNNFEREYELKWGVHYGCHNKLMGVADRNTR